MCLLLVHSVLISSKRVYNIMLMIRDYSSGGPKAWKEMRQRQMDFYQGWDQDEAMKKKPDREEGDSELQEEFEGDDDDDGGAAAEEEDAFQAKKRADEDEEEQGEPVSLPFIYRT